MEKIKALLQESNKAFNVADHLTYVTYPLIKDTKLLTTIAENLYVSLIKSMEAVLYYDRLYKRIPEYPPSFIEMFQIFKVKCVPRYHIPREGLVIIQDIHQFLENRKKSALEFSRKDKFIIATREYRLSALTLDKLKNYLYQSRTFLNQINNVLLKEIKRFEDVRRVRG